MQMVKARTMSIFGFGKRTIEAILFEQKRPGTDGGNNFLSMINLVHIVP